MEKREIKISFGTFVCLMIIAVLVIAIMGMGLYMSNNNLMFGKEKLYLESNLVKDLYKYVSDQNIVGIDPEASFYALEKTTNDTINEDLKTYVVLRELLNEGTYTVEYNRYQDNQYVADNQLPLITVSNMFDYAKKQYNATKTYSAQQLYKFSMEDVQEKSQEMFNRDVTIQNHSYDMRGNAFLYYDNAYRYIVSDGGVGDGYAGGYTELQKAEKSGDEIYLYDNQIYIEPKDVNNGMYIDLEGYEVFANTHNNKYKIAETYQEKVNIEDYLKLYEREMDAKKIENALGIKLPLYKHTFKQIADGGYYWVSSELINKDELKIIE